MEHCDHQFGRLLDTLEQIGELDNTIIIVLPDNGASSEGGVNGAFNEMSSFNNYYETLHDTPYGSIGRPCLIQSLSLGLVLGGQHPVPPLEERSLSRRLHRYLVHWPAGIKATGENRSQYAHAIDMVPIYDAIGITPPDQIRGVAQSPIEGVSFAHTFNDAEAPTKHHTQYFEMFATCAIDHDGWRAVCGFPGPSYAEGAERGLHLGDEITPRIAG